MIKIELEIIEEKIAKVLKELNDEFETAIKIDGDCRPGAFFKSNVLVTAINRVADALEVSIPNNCYIFSDKKECKQLSIKEAALKVREKAIHKPRKEVIHGT